MKTILIPAALAIVLSSVGVGAQEGQRGVGHAENHDWYGKLRRPDNGGSCCNNKDCRPTRAYVDDDGNWRAQIDGKWVPVPKDVVLNTRAPDGNSHICTNDLGIIRCFIGGEPKS